MWCAIWGTYWGTHWEPREHIGNLMVAWWEPIGNLKGTCWEQRKNEKKILPPTHTKLKIKKTKALWVHAEPSHWLHEISMFQNCSSPFLALSNTPIINWGYLFYWEQQKIPKHQIALNKKKKNWAPWVDAGSPIFFTIFGLG
jgi:hypothetical protein